MKAARLSSALAYAVAFAAAPVFAQTAQSPSQADMKAKVHALIDAMNAGDVAKAASFYAANGMVEDPAGTALKKGPEFLEAMIGRKIHYEFAAPVRTSSSNQAAMDVNITIGAAKANAVEVFTFNPDGKISGMKAYVELPGAKAPEQVAAQNTTKRNLMGLIEAVNRGDLAKAKSFYTQDATIEDPVGSPLRKADAFAQGLISRKAQYEYVAPVRGTAQKAALMDVKVRVGNSVVNAIEIYSFDDAGKINNMKAYWGSEDRQ